MTCRRPHVYVGRGGPGRCPPAGAPHRMEEVPSDKILCQGRFRRKVVACMHHCPVGEQYCTAFWRFFRERGQTPVEYYNEDRTHCSLDKDAPCSRPVQTRPSEEAKVVPFPRVGGLHHRYEWREAA